MKHHFDDYLIVSRVYLEVWTGAPQVAGDVVEAVVVVVVDANDGGQEQVGYFGKCQEH